MLLWNAISCWCQSIASLNFSSNFLSSVPIVVPKLLLLPLPQAVDVLVELLMLPLLSFVVAVVKRLDLELELLLRPVVLLGDLTTTMAFTHTLRLKTYVPPDHTGHCPTDKIVVGATEKPKGLPKYQPPNHTGPVPVVKEVAEGCYDGVYGVDNNAISGKK